MNKINNKNTITYTDTTSHSKTSVLNKNEWVPSNHKYKKRAKEIELYCGSKNRNVFGLNDWADLKDQVGILPLGITHTEKQILEALNNCGSATLTGLAAKIGMSKTALQRDHELYLLNKDLIEIDGKRKITSQGLTICKTF